MLIVISGDKRVDEKKLKKIFSAKKARMATPKEVFEVTGFKVGGVSPIGHIHPLQVYVDESLNRYDIIYPAAGESNNMFPSNFDELLFIANAKKVSVAKE